MAWLSVGKLVGDDTVVDRIEIETCGLMRVVGWSLQPHTQVVDRLSVLVNGVLETGAHAYWHPRPDVPAPGHHPAGFCVEWDLGSRLVESIDLRLDGRESLFDATGLGVQCARPHFDGLRTTSAVLHREHVYGSGPQWLHASPELMAMAKTLAPPILDVGCGSGAAIGELRAAGIEAYGIELNLPSVRSAMSDEVRPFVTLGDGSFPMPFADRQFGSVLCSEVLEHIPNYEDALGEIARVCRSEFLLTVPDVEAVSVLHKHGVVPWHLLEGSHVNFFTHTSLDALLRRYFGKVSIGRLGAGHINGTMYWVSLMARCEEPVRVATIR